MTPSPAPGADGKYASGAVVQLTANANTAAGYSFSAWSGDASGSGNPVNVTMNGNKSVTATFTPPRYTLTLTPSPSGGGSISASPPPDADGKYASGTVVQLMANANTAAGYSFSAWSGDASGFGQSGQCHDERQQERDCHLHAAALHADADAQSVWGWIDQRQSAARRRWQVCLWDRRATDGQCEHGSRLRFQRVER